MKKLTLVITLVIISVLVTIPPAQAEEMALFDITVEFEYTPPPSPMVTGYHLYRNGERIVFWEWQPINVRSVILYLPENTDSNFTLAAVFDDGTESPPSAPYLFNPGTAAIPGSPSDFKRVSSIFGKVFPKNAKLFKIKIG